MRILKLAAGLVAWLLLAGVAFAAGTWTVERASQPARFTLDGQSWTELAPGMLLPETSWIHTGPRGRLMLRRGTESILFKPNTLAEIVARNDAERRTDIRQRVGTLVLDLERRDRPHTAVATPFLAAVVKGTRFAVQVGRTGAQVRVRRGIVEVTDISRGERADIRARQSVTVTPAAGTPMSVQGFGAKAVVQRVAPAAAAIAPVNSGAIRAAEPRATASRAATMSGPAAGAASPGRGSDGDGDGDKGSVISARGADGGKPGGDGKGKPGGNGNGKPDGDGNGKPGGNGHSKPGGNGDGKPDGDGNGKPGGNGHGKPDGNGDGKPDGDGNGKPGGNGHGKPSGGNDGNGEPGGGNNGGGGTSGGEDDGTGGDDAGGGGDGDGAGGDGNGTGGDGDGDGTGGDGDGTAGDDDGDEDEDEGDRGDEGEDD